MLCVLLDFLEIKQIFLVMATPSHPAPHSDLFRIAKKYSEA
jgi:hypothetical protein